MRKIAKDYYGRIKNLLSLIEAKDKRGRSLDFYQAINKVSSLIESLRKGGNKILFIGNGASASISSHMAVDFWKNAGIPALAFNDISLLTSVSNDFGYKYVFEKPIEMFAKKGDILFSISSSGKSENILRATKKAKSKKCKIVTLSGFKRNNPLRVLGDFNFYVPESSYGPVEVLHHSICHCILDSVKNERRAGC